MPFLHACGHRPLVGYTIKRGISKGGFGEVYFGLTDGGKEVALKRLVKDQDIELRGIRQCLNLKHPHLVHLYDLKTDDRGDHWLVMEYIRGETLQSLLQKHPKGLSPELIRPWFQQLAAAVHSLHEQGIVHRDLKPANVFLEAGLVKVGDYGLCKFIGGSQHRAQSQHVGTVHYMAPEIGKGNYSRPIDIYAAGILLYEMATGQVPYEGETTAEILFKHLTATPDLSKAGPFASIISKAIKKEPADRFSSLTEMARRVAETEPQLARPTVETMRSEPIVLTPAEPPSAPKPASSLPRALTLAGLLAAAGAMIFLNGNWPRILPTFALAALGSWGVILLSHRWQTRTDDSFTRRLQLGAFGVALGALSIWMQGHALLTFDGAVETHGQIAYFGLMFAALRWWHLADPVRPKRFAWMPMWATLLWGCGLLFLLTEDRRVSLASVMITAAAVQLATPRRDPPPKPAKRLRLGYV